MTQPGDRKIDRWFFLVSFTADILAILTWAGIPANGYSERFAVVATLATVAALLAVFVIYSFVRRWLSPFDSIYGADYVQLLGSILVLLVSAGLFYALTKLPKEMPGDRPNTPTTTSISPATPSGHS